MEDKIQEFFNFIEDRQLVWYRRFVLKQPRPWCYDPILDTYKFCNVYRELDKGTQHLIINVINKNLPIETKVFNIMIYRRFNVFGFFTEILNEPINPKIYDFKYLESLLDKRKSEGKLLFNEAYMLCQRTFASDYRKSDKHIQTLLAQQKIAKEINTVVKNIINAKDLKSIHEYLQTFPLIGAFLSFQILTDLTYVSDFLKHDINSYVSVGPGAIGGLEYIFGKLKQSEHQKYCKKLWLNQGEHLNENWLKIRYKDAYCQEYISLSNIQNCLCEFRKFKQLQINPKARKRYYKGGR